MKTSIVEKSIKHMITYAKHHSATILSIVGASGVVITAFTSGKATNEVTKNLEIAKKKKGKLNSLETATIILPPFIPVILTGGGSIICILGANVLNKKRQASLISAYSLLDASFKEYRNKLIELHGEECAKEIQNSISNDYLEKAGLEVTPNDNKKCLFFEPISDRFFEMTMEEMIDVKYQLNRDFILNGSVELNHFYNLIGIEETEPGICLGWSESAGLEFYGYGWIDIVLDLFTNNGKDYYSIRFPFPPTTDYDSY